MTMRKVTITLFVLFLILSATSLTVFQEKDQGLSDPVSGEKRAAADLVQEKEAGGIPVVLQEKPETKTSITSTENRSREDRPDGKVDPDGLVLRKFGPNDIKRGEVFNKQPNGESAIWAQADNVTSTTILVLNGEVLVSQAHVKDNLITAFVPKKLYASPGEYPLYLLDTKTDKKSNALKFIVK